jgi:2-phospho-L-lactate guanylyltransferase
VNRLDRAKGRLAALLDAEQRAELALTTLATAWEAAIEATGQAVILTADPRVASLLGPGAEVLDEDATLAGLNAQLTGARARLIARGRIGTAEPILILHADLPLATPGAIEALVAMSPGEHSATMVASGDGGTNALLEWPAGRMALAYGPGSAAKHEQAAREAGLAVAWQESPALALDLDTPADVLALLNDASGVRSPAGRLLSTFDLRAKLEAEQ